MNNNKLSIMIMDIWSRNKLALRLFLLLNLTGAIFAWDTDDSNVVNGGGEMVSQIPMVEPGHPDFPVPDAATRSTTLTIISTRATSRSTSGRGQPRNLPTGEPESADHDRGINPDPDPDPLHPWVTRPSNETTQVSNSSSTQVPTVDVTLANTPGPVTTSSTNFTSTVTTTLRSDVTVSTTQSNSTTSNATMTTEIATRTLGGNRTTPGNLQSTVPGSTTSEPSSTNAAPSATSATPTREIVATFTTTVGTTDGVTRAATSGRVTFDSTTLGWTRPQSSTTHNLPSTRPTDSLTSVRTTMNTDHAVSTGSSPGSTQKTTPQNSHISTSLYTSVSSTRSSTPGDSVTSITPETTDNTRSEGGEGSSPANMQSTTNSFTGQQHSSGPTTTSTTIPTIPTTLNHTTGSRMPIVSTSSVPTTENQNLTSQSLMSTRGPTSTIQPVQTTTRTSSASPAPWFWTTTPGAHNTEPRGSTTASETSPSSNGLTSQTATTATLPTTPWYWPFTTRAALGTTRYPPIPSSPFTTQRIPTPFTTQRNKPVTTGKQHPHNSPSLSSSSPLSSTVYPSTSLEPITANASYRLAAYVQLRLSTHWLMFCPDNQEILQTLTDYSRVVLNLPSYHIVSAMFLNVRYNCPSARVRRMKRLSTAGVVPVDFYVAINNTYYENSTRKVGAAVVADPSTLQQYIPFQIVSAHILAPEKAVTPAPQHPGNNQDVVIGTTLTMCALVFGVILALVAVKIHRMRKLHASQFDRYYFDGKQLQDTMSESHTMGRMSVTGVAGSLPAPTYREYFLASINKGLVMDDEDDFDGVVDDEALPSHILTDSALAKFYSYTEAIGEEFQNLPGHESLRKLSFGMGIGPHHHIPKSPHNTPKLLDKHKVDGLRKFSVAIGLTPHHHTPTSPDRTKVDVMASPDHGKSDCVIDASFIRGYDSTHCRYIAARVSGADSSEAFWKTIWEQQTRTIICLCSPYELGSLCPHYWPSNEGGPGAQLYGNILVTLKGGASGEHYFTSSLVVRNVEKTLCRPVTHYWFTQWTEKDVPWSTQALMSMLLQVHNTHQESYGPVFVHCSDGIGRTGMVIATDINMQRMEESHTIDIPRTVSTVRQDRGQAVLNIDQYTFIYKTLYEFSKFLGPATIKETSDTESVIALENDDSISSHSREERASMSSRASSYLGDLSATVRRRLALKFPGLAFKFPSLQSPTKTEQAGREFVVINSPKSTNLDVSTVSGLTDSGKHNGSSLNSTFVLVDSPSLNNLDLSMTSDQTDSERLDESSFNLSLSSPLDQTYLSIHDEVFEDSHIASDRVCTEHDKPFGSGPEMSSNDSWGSLTSGPGSARQNVRWNGRKHLKSARGIGRPGDNGSEGSSWTLSSSDPECASQRSSSGKGSSASERRLPSSQIDSVSHGQMSKLSESMISSNPFKLDIEEEIHPQPIAASRSHLEHASQPSYPVDMNPFGSSSIVLSKDHSPSAGAASSGVQETAFGSLSGQLSHASSASSQDGQSMHSLTKDSGSKDDYASLFVDILPKDDDVLHLPMPDHVPSLPASDHVPNLPASDPVPPPRGLKRKDTYPREINPFETSVTKQATSTNTVNQSASIPVTMEAPVAVSHLKTSASDSSVMETTMPSNLKASELVRQGTYPKGRNPFDDSGSLKGSSMPPRPQVDSDSAMLQLKPVEQHHEQIDSASEAKASSANKVSAYNPFMLDWMDDAEESFT